MSQIKLCTCLGAPPLRHGEVAKMPAAPTSGGGGANSENSTSLSSCDCCLGSEYGLSSPFVPNAVRMQDTGRRFVMDASMHCMRLGGGLPSLDWRASAKRSKSPKRGFHCTSPAPSQNSTRSKSPGRNRSPIRNRFTGATEGGFWADIPAGSKDDELLTSSIKSSSGLSPLSLPLSQAGSTFSNGKDTYTVGELEVMDPAEHALLNSHAHLPWQARQCPRALEERENKRFVVALAEERRRVACWCEAQQERAGDAATDLQQLMDRWWDERAVEIHKVHRDVQDGRRGSVLLEIHANLGEEMEKKRMDALLVHFGHDLMELDSKEAARHRQLLIDVERIADRSVQEIKMVDFVQQRRGLAAAATASSSIANRRDASATCLFIGLIALQAQLRVEAQRRFISNCAAEAGRMHAVLMDSLQEVDRIWEMEMRKVAEEIRMEANRCAEWYKMQKRIQQGVVSKIQLVLCPPEVSQDGENWADRDKERMRRLFHGVEQRAESVRTSFTKYWEGEKRKAKAVNAGWITSLDEWHVQARQNQCKRASKEQKEHSALQLHSQVGFQSEREEANMKRKEEELHNFLTGLRETERIWAVPVDTLLCDLAPKFDLIVKDVLGAGCKLERQLCTDLQSIGERFRTQIAKSVNASVLTLQSLEVMGSAGLLNNIQVALEDTKVQQLSGCQKFGHELIERVAEAIRTSAPESVRERLKNSMLAAASPSFVEVDAQGRLATCFENVIQQAQAGVSAGMASQANDLDAARELLKEWTLTQQSHKAKSQLQAEEMIRRWTKECKCSITDGLMFPPHTPQSCEAEEVYSSLKRLREGRKERLIQLCDAWECKLLSFTVALLEKIANESDRDGEMAPNKIDNSPDTAWDAMMSKMREQVEAAQDTASASALEMGKHFEEQCLSIQAKIERVVSQVVTSYEAAISASPETPDFASAATFRNISLKTIPDAAPGGKRGETISEQAQAELAQIRQKTTSQIKHLQDALKKKRTSESSLESTEVRASTHSADDEASHDGEGGPPKALKRSSSTISDMAQQARRISNVARKMSSKLLGRASDPDSLDALEGGITARISHCLSDYMAKLEKLKMDQEGAFREAGSSASASYEALLNELTEKISSFWQQQQEERTIEIEAFMETVVEDSNLDMSLQEQLQSGTQRILAALQQRLAWEGQQRIQALRDQASHLENALTASVSAATKDENVRISEIQSGIKKSSNSTMDLIRADIRAAKMEIEALSVLHS
jgi:hypothetical protein